MFLPHQHHLHDPPVRTGCDPAVVDAGVEILRVEFKLMGSFDHDLVCQGGDLAAQGTENPDGPM
jgi:hypothetical protein